jgi:hypothetical protein
MGSIGSEEKRTDEVTKAAAIQWWNQEMRVSPTQK